MTRTDAMYISHIYSTLHVYRNMYATPLSESLVCDYRAGTTKRQAGTCCVNDYRVDDGGPGLDSKVLTELSNSPAFPGSLPLLLLPLSVCDLVQGRLDSCQTSLHHRRRHVGPGVSFLECRVRRAVRLSCISGEFAPSCPTKSRVRPVKLTPDLTLQPEHSKVSSLSAGRNTHDVVVHVHLDKALYEYADTTINNELPHCLNILLIFVFLLDHFVQRRLTRPLKQERHRPTRDVFHSQRRPRLVQHILEVDRLQQRPRAPAAGLGLGPVHELLQDGVLDALRCRRAETVDVRPLAERGKLRLLLPQVLEGVSMITKRTRDGHGLLCPASRCAPA